MTLVLLSFILLLSHKININKLSISSLIILLSLPLLYRDDESEKREREREKKRERERGRERGRERE